MRDDLPPGRERPAPRPLAAGQASSARTAARSGTTIASDWDGETVAVECRPRPRRLGASAAAGPGRVSPFGGDGEAALEPRVGGAVEPVRRHDRAQRQGPRDRRRVARPVGRDRPRGLRARAAAQLPLRVPQHRRQARCRPPRAWARPPTRSPRSCRRSRRGSCSSGRGRRARSTSTPRGPTRSRACSTSSTGWAPRPPAARSRASCPSGYDSIFRYSLLDPAADVEQAAGAFRPAFAHLALLVQVPGVDVHARVVARRRGRPLTEAEAAELEVRLAAVGRWLEAYAPERARIEIRRDALPVEADQLRPEQRGFLRALAEAAHGDAPGDGRAVAGGDLRRRRGPRPRRQGRVQWRSTSRSSAGRTGRVRAGCWRASTAAS